MYEAHGCWHAFVGADTLVKNFSIALLEWLPPIESLLGYLIGKPALHVGMATAIECDGERG